MGSYPIFGTMNFNFASCIDIIEKMCNISETHFLLKCFKTDKGFLIDITGDKQISITKELYKELYELSLINNKIELIIK